MNTSPVSGSISSSQAWQPFGNVGAAAERDRVGVTLHEAYVLERNAQPVGDELRVGRGVSLPVRMRPGDDRHHAARVEAQLHALVEDAGILEVVDERAATQAAFRFARLLPGGKAF